MWNRTNNKLITTLTQPKPSHHHIHACTIIYPISIPRAHQVCYSIRTAHTPKSKHITETLHESSVGLSSTTNPSLGVAIPVPAQAHLYTHAKGRAT